MVDHRRPICPRPRHWTRPTSLILPGGCILSGCSPPHAPPRGCSTSTTTSTLRTPLVDHFAAKSDFNAPSTKTNRLPDCCRRRHLGGPYLRHLGGPFLLALARAWTARTEIGRGPSTNCGQTSTIAYVSSRKRLRALARNFSPSKPLVPLRRSVTALTRKNVRNERAPRSGSVRNERSPRSAVALTRPPSTRPPSTRKPSTRSPSMPRVPYSHGFDDAASTPDSPDRPPGDSYVRPLLHA